MPRDGGSSEPYKGLESYQAEDAELFFGRDRESEQLLAMILSSRFLLLHAPSGAGKTSLLNARIIPQLERRGHVPIRTRPYDDPLDSVRVATLQYLLPPPAAEIEAVERALEGLGLDRDARLDEILRRHRELEVRDVEKRRLVAPVTIDAAPERVALPKFGSTEPYFCRLLRASIHLETYSRHLAATRPDAAGGDPEVGGGTSAGRLLELLEELGPAHEQMLERLYVPTPDLRAFFENLLAVYRRPRSPLSLVLILDQFEELFTRFVDPGPTVGDAAPDLPDWRLRWELFEELEELHRAATGENHEGSEDAALAAALPLRVVISIREEYIARLDPIRRFVPDLDHSFHLSLLDKRMASEAIRRPARHYGYSYADECYERLIAELANEDRFVEPAHIQIVCEKLWQHRGSELAEHGEDAGVGAPDRRIEAATFDELGGARGILGSYFHGFLQAFESDEAFDRDEQRLETLELVEPLITASGTRNIVARETLLTAPYRRRELRERLLSDLVDRRFLRVRQRLGQHFVEITHEFLIQSIHEAIRREMKRDPDYGRLREALRALAGAQQGHFRGASSSPLPAVYLKLLTAHRRRLDWGYWGAELILRCAILEGLSKDGLSREDLSACIDEYRHSGPTLPVDRLLPAKSELEETQTIFSRDELREINRQRESLEPRVDQLERLLRSELIKAGDGERGDVIYWTVEYRNHVA